MKEIESTTSSVETQEELRTESPVNPNSLPVPVPELTSAHGGSGGRWHGPVWGAVFGSLGSLFVAALLLPNTAPRLNVTAEILPPDRRLQEKAEAVVVNSLETITLEGAGSAYDRLLVSAIAEDADRPTDPPSAQDITWELRPDLGSSSVLSAYCDDAPLVDGSCISGKILVQKLQPGKQDLRVSYIDSGNWLGIFPKSDAHTVRIEVVEVPVPMPQILPEVSSIYTNEVQTLTAGGRHLRGQSSYSWRAYSSDGLLRRSHEGPSFPFMSHESGLYSIVLTVSDEWHAEVTTSAELEVISPTVVPTAQSQLVANAAQGFVSFPQETVVLSGEIFTFGEPLEIRARKVVASHAIIRAFPSDSEAQAGQEGSDGSSGRNGGGGGQSGSDGQQGLDGAAGASGSTSGHVIIEAAFFEGSLTIDTTGQAGGDGGRGGQGGDGGSGGPGSNGASGAFDCSRGPGNGGNGGNAGAGGDGGSAGAGGDAGEVVVSIGEASPNARIDVVAEGGAAGDPGPPGMTGSPGAGGPRGSAPGWCQQTARHGTSGQSASPGARGASGSPGSDGTISLSIGDTSLRASKLISWP